MVQFEPFYIDHRGWTYRVMPGIGHCFKARFRRQGPFKESKWKCVASLPWRSTLQEAEADLLQYAKTKNMKYIYFKTDPNSGGLVTASVMSANKFERMMNNEAV